MPLASRTLKELLIYIENQKRFNEEENTLKNQCKI
jgi:hypothetical protein